MNLRNGNNWPVYDWHVLVLHDGLEKDILGIWGPYISESDAEFALEELKKWPLDGTWTVMEIKSFPTPQAKTIGTTDVQWNPHQHWGGGQPRG